MFHKKIDASLIQETHLAADFVKIIGEELTFIHHGPESQPYHGANKGGVGIILSNMWPKAWCKGESIMREGGLQVGQMGLLSTDVVVHNTLNKPY